MRISLDIPEQCLKGERPAELSRRVALYAALMMFRTNELSAGAATEFAGVDRFTFAAACRQHGIPLVDYDPRDLESELNSPQRTS